MSPRALWCSKPIAVMMASFKVLGEYMLVASLAPPRPASVMAISTCIVQYLSVTSRILSAKVLIAAGHTTPWLAFPLCSVVSACMSLKHTTTVCTAPAMEAVRVLCLAHIVTKLMRLSNEVCVCAPFRCGAWPVSWLSAMNLVGRVPSGSCIWVAVSRGSSMPVSAGSA